LAALARIASGCTRLVDSVFASDQEHRAKSTQNAPSPSTPPSPPKP
jgi:hypothetical protein